MRSYPSTIQATYSELVQRLQDDAIVEIGGKPIMRDIRGRDYWYAITRVGRKQVERYLGPDSAAMRERVRRLEEDRRSLKQREKERGTLVRILREAGLPTTDAYTGKIILALSRAGVFRLRSVLVGTHAYRCYSAILGIDLEEAHAVTQDVDIAQDYTISIAIDDHVDPEINEALAKVGPFQARPTLHKTRHTAWRDTQTNFAVELLAPNEGPDRDEPLELPALGAYAQPLRFLSYLVHEPVSAAVLYRYGVLVNIPQPARYAIHKLIVATRRNRASVDKATKDVRQAAELIQSLAEIRPDELEAAWLEARERGAKWRKSMDAGVRRLPRQAKDALNESLAA